MWKIEYINTTIAILGLVVASVTAYSEFRTKPDDLSVTSKGRIISQDVLSVNAGIGPTRDAGIFGPLVGPISWEIQVFNPSARPVTITAFKVFHPSGFGPMSHYSGMNEKLAVKGSSSVELALPDVISEGHAKTYTLSLYVPTKPTVEQERICLNENKPLLDLERCFYSLGTDLFGNRAIKSEYTSPDMQVISYGGIPAGPEFILEIETGDGSKNRISLIY